MTDLELRTCVFRSNYLSSSLSACSHQLLMVDLEELFDAYYDCRKSKRTTTNSLKFELNFEAHINDLCNAINSRTFTTLTAISVLSSPNRNHVRFSLRTSRTGSSITTYSTNSTHTLRNGSYRTFSTVVKVKVLSTVFNAYRTT